MSNYSAASGLPACTPDLEPAKTRHDKGPTTVGDLEYVHRILHAVNVRTLMVEVCGFPSDHEDASRQTIAREVALQNRTCGWVTVPLTGNEEEDVEDFWGGIDTASILCRARPINRRREPVRVRLDRPRLELLLLAHGLLQKRVNSVFKRTDLAVRERAVADARAMLASNWPAALNWIAAAFQGSPEQRLRQLGWLLDGSEPGLVVCRHCYHLIVPHDPHLVLDREDEAAARRRESGALPRYSAHAACHAVHGA